MRRSRTRSRLETVALLVCVWMVAGCAYVRVPRIDPTGRRVFVEPPISTVPRSREEPARQQPSDDVAVILSPHVTVAPVGSEVVLLAGVRGVDGFLRTNRRLEWSLAPGGVGHFVAVGKNGPIDLLVGDFTRPRKIDNTFAVGSTSRRYVHLNRGTPTTSDDVCVLRGQGWITLTSPLEGTSHVTVFAPTVHGWDNRTRGAMVHWVDAQWRFPPPAINPTGTTHVLTTTVMRHTTQCPCAGWRVRYEIADGPPGGFAPDGAQSIEVLTDAAGQASAEIRQTEPKPGTNTINIQIVRPAELGGSQGRQLLVGSGTTTKTWTSADLGIRKTGPATAGLGTTLNYTIEVSNPGDLPADEVIVTDELPPLLTYLDSSPAAEPGARKLQWRLGQLGAGETRTIALNCRVAQQGSVTNCADVTAAGGLKASDCAVTTVTAAKVDVQITGPVQASVGSDVSFRVVITNRSQVATKGLLIKDRFGGGLEHAAAPSPIERELGDLAPGESREVDVTFRVTRPGRLCHTVDVTGLGGVKASAEGCVTAVGVPAAERAVEQPRPQPSVTIKKSIVGATDTERPVRNVGEMVHFAIDITNSGTGPLSNLEVVDRYHDSLTPKKASEGYKQQRDDLTLAWTLDSLAPGETTRLEVVCKCLTPVAEACNRVAVTTPDGIKAEDEACLEIRAAPGGLTMTVADLRDPVAAGKGLTYELRVTNQSQTAARQIAVVATVPAGMTVDPIGTSGPGKPSIDRQTIRFEPVAEIRPGETLRYHVRVQTRLSGKLTFRAQLTSQNLPQPLSVEETTEVFQ